MRTVSERNDRSINERKKNIASQLQVMYAVAAHNLRLVLARVTARANESGDEAREDDDDSRLRVQYSHRRDALRVSPLPSAAFWYDASSLETRDTDSN